MPTLWVDRGREGAGEALAAAGLGAAGLGLAAGGDGLEGAPPADAPIFWRPSGVMERMLMPSSLREAPSFSTTTSHAFCHGSPALAAISPNFTLPRTNARDKQQSYLPSDRRTATSCPTPRLRPSRRNSRPSSKEFGIGSPILPGLLSIDTPTTPGTLASLLAPARTLGIVYLFQIEPIRDMEDGAWITEGLNAPVGTNASAGAGRWTKHAKPIMRTGATSARAACGHLAFIVELRPMVTDCKLLCLFSEYV
eukprot:1791096-Rhodomonas_salina.1